ncbi:MAG TPA: site-2 protease family protein [Gemmataceae bacterium]|nr:site-2 protease family protein [Gemmataceae bacterium]
MELALNNTADRRKQVRLKVRGDLVINTQRYEGKTCYVVKDPVSLRYYRFNEQEYFVVKQFDGRHTMEETQKEFETKFRPNRLTHEDLEGFARQLLTAGLVQHESASAAEELLQSRKKQRRLQRIATITNILYIKIPVIDPDRLLNHMCRWLWWIFTPWFFAASILLMFSAIVLVATHFATFYDKLPYYQEFFAFNRLLYMWIALGIVKVIHEFGHGLSCKAYGGECHEMGFLFMCLSPALYCNVSDSWTMADKWKRIIISFAGIYVELIIAALATWVWWYTPGRPFINNIALCLMTLCSVSTIVFNANPLMKFDGYYILADWLEIPNLRDRANRFLKNLAAEYCLGMEVQPEPYMTASRKVLFVVYAIVSYIYRWVVTFSIIYTISNLLKPYGMESLSMLLAMAALGSMIGWPIYRAAKNINQRGRLPDMKRERVTATSVVVFILILIFFLLPLPISRVRDKGVVEIEESASDRIYLPYPKGGTLQEVLVQDGEWVEPGRVLTIFRNFELESLYDEAKRGRDSHRSQYLVHMGQAANAGPPAERKRFESAAADEISQANVLDHLEKTLKRHIDSLVVRAPRSGYVISPPRKEMIGKFWEDVQSQPICQIGDTRKLKVKVPVAPHDYELMKQDLERSANRELPVRIHVPGAGLKVYHGRVTWLPTSDARNVPIQLTYKGGGSLATKPAENPNMLEPQSQVYLVEVEITDSDDLVRPGVLPVVKIECHWRTAAWWCWRAINVALDLKLM